MKEFYIEFKTWKEGSFEIPWQFWRITGIKDYRLRNNLKISADDELIKNIFLSFDESAVGEFLEKYVAADTLAIICSAENIETAVKEIENCFDIIEIVGHLELDDTTKQLIKEKWGN